MASRIKSRTKLLYGYAGQQERGFYWKNTRKFNTFSFYAEQTSDLIHAFLVEVTGGTQDLTQIILMI